MRAVPLDGRAAAQAVLADVREGASRFRQERGRPVGLAFVTVGADEAASSYARGRESAATKVGFYSELHALSPEMGTGALRRFVARLSESDGIDGIIVSLPLPAALDEDEALSGLSYRKDVDGVTAESAGRSLAGLPAFWPCTAESVVELLRFSGTPLDGAGAVVVGRSRVVGRPAALLLLAENATVTVAHSHTKNLAALAAGADILVAAVGRPRVITPDMVRPGAVVVDVGIHEVDGRLTGDVDPAVAEVAGALSPVPGGVGPLTSAILMRHTLEAATWRS